MISVALIEDNRLVRDGIAALMNQQPDLEVVASARSAHLAPLRKANPQVVLLDAGLRDADSVRAAITVMKEFPESKVVVMDLLPADEEIVQFVNAGVHGFVLKDATFDDLVTTIRLVAGGGHVLPPPMTGTLFSQIARDAVARDRTAALAVVRMTPREREVVHWIGEGLSNKEIAEQLDIATHTVKSHVRNVMEKLTLHTRLQIAAYAHGTAHGS